MKPNKVINLIKKKDAHKRAVGAGAAGAVIGAAAGYMKGKKDGAKGHKKTASDINRYLEKIAASIGAIGKALIRTKLAPGMANMSKSTASRVEGISRAMAGSKVAPRVFSTPEMSQHATAMHSLGKKLMPNSGGMDWKSTNKVMAVAARARRMGVIPGKD